MENTLLGQNIHRFEVKWSLMHLLLVKTSCLDKERMSHLVQDIPSRRHAGVAFHSRLLNPCISDANVSWMKWVLQNSNRTLCLHWQINFEPLWLKLRMDLHCSFVILIIGNLILVNCLYNLVWDSSMFRTAQKCKWCPKLFIADLLKMLDLGV